MHQNLTPLEALQLEIDKHMTIEDIETQRQKLRLYEIAGDPPSIDWGNIPENQHELLKKYIKQRARIQDYRYIEKGTDDKAPYEFFLGSPAELNHCFYRFLEGHGHEKISDLIEFILQFGCESVERYLIKQGRPPSEFSKNTAAWKLPIVPQVPEPCDHQPCTHVRCNHEPCDHELCAHGSPDHERKDLEPSDLIHGMDSDIQRAYMILLSKDLILETMQKIRELQNPELVQSFHSVFFGCFQFSLHLMGFRTSKILEEGIRAPRNREKGQRAPKGRRALHHFIEKYLKKMLRKDPKITVTTFIKELPECGKVMVDGEEYTISNELDVDEKSGSLYQARKQKNGSIKEGQWSFSTTVKNCYKIKKLLLQPDT